jgi:hypothetical protein
LGLVLLFSVTVSDLTYIGCARSGKTENGAREKDSISGATDGVTANFAFGFHSGTVPFSVFPNFTRRSSRESFCSHLTVLFELEHCAAYDLVVNLDVQPIGADSQAARTQIVYVLAAVDSEVRSVVGGAAVNGLIDLSVTPPAVRVTAIVAGGNMHVGLPKSVA